MKLSNPTVCPIHSVSESEWMSEWLNWNVCRALVYQRDHAEAEDGFEHQGEFVLCDLWAEAKERVENQALNTAERNQMAAQG
jgi:hypothetical protein